MPNEYDPIRIRTRLKIVSGLPNALPYLSVFFLLLIFFMLGSSFVQVSGIPVELPETRMYSSFGMKKRVVTVAKDGKIYFNDMQIESIDRFKNKLVEIAGTASLDKPAIVLRADQSANFGTVAKIMSIAEELKINVFILTASARQTAVSPTVAE